MWLLRKLTNLNTFFVKVRLLRSHGEELENKFTSSHDQINAEVQILVSIVFASNKSFQLLLLHSLIVGPLSWLYWFLFQNHISWTQTSNMYGSKDVSEDDTRTRALVPSFQSQQHHNASKQIALRTDRVSKIPLTHYLKYYNKLFFKVRWTFWTYSFQRVLTIICFLILEP